MQTPYNSRMPIEPLFSDLPAPPSELAPLKRATLGFLPRFVAMSSFLEGLPRRSLIVPSAGLGQPLKTHSVLPLSRQSGMASLEVLEAMSGRPLTRVAALVQLWHCSSGPCHAEVAVTLASHGRQELLLEGFKVDYLEQVVVRMGAVEIGPLQPQLDVVHEAIECSLAK